MTKEEFEHYWPLLSAKPFSIYPAPKGPDGSKNWNLAQFTLHSVSNTHVTIIEVDTETSYLVPLALVEVANPGVLRVTRQRAAYNGSFV